jgi:hypothetical protein
MANLLRFAHGEAIDMLRDSVRAFAEAEIAPRAAEIDATNSFPRDLWPKLGDRGRGIVPRVRLRRPVVGRAFEPVREPARPLGNG